MPCDDEEAFLDQQIRTLRSEICLNESNILTRKRICKALESIFTHPFSDQFSSTSQIGSIHMFGSSINGLGCKGCDLDIYVEWPGTHQIFFELEIKLIK